MKLVIISIATIVLVGVSGYFLARGTTTNTRAPQTQDNVSVVEGGQIVAITARGGYSPRISNAQANIPTVLKMVTNGTFDCSSSLVIPSLNYRTNLPPSVRLWLKCRPNSQEQLCRAHAAWACITLL